MRIVIDIIPPYLHRYPTCGDWEMGHGGNLHIRVSEMPDWRDEAALAIHELVEALACRHGGVSSAVVDIWDRGPEDPSDPPFDRGPGGTAKFPPDWSDYDEPGEHPHAPYHTQHVFAELLESQFLAHVGREVRDYNAALELAFLESAKPKEGLIIESGGPIRMDPDRIIEVERVD